MMELIFLLNALKIYAPMHNSPFTQYPQHTQVPIYNHQTTQQMVYQVYIPVGYTYDPQGYLNEYMRMQSSQQAFDVPIHGQQHPQSYQTSPIIPSYIQTSHQNIHLHPAYVHHGSFLTSHLAHPPTMVNRHPLNHIVPHPIHAVPANIPHYQLISHPPPVMVNPTRQTHRHVHYPRPNNAGASSISMSQQNIQEPPTVVNSMVQPQTVSQEEKVIIEEPDQLIVDLQNKLTIGSSESRLDLEDLTPAKSMDVLDQGNVEIADSSDKSEMKSKDNPSGDNTVLSAISEYPIPEYEKILIKLFEVGRCYQILGQNPNTIVYLQHIDDIYEKCFYICLINGLRKKFKFVKGVVKYCCYEQFVKKIKEKAELQEFCENYAYIIHNLPRKELIQLKTIIPYTVINYKNIQLTNKEH